MTAVTRNVLKITSENQAFEVLDLALKNQLAEFDELVFEGWPNFELYIKGEKFNQSITATVMDGLIDLQRGLYRAYAIANYNTPKKRLTNEEKEELELAIKVNDGSSSFESNISEIATNVAKELVGKMKGSQIVVVLLTLMLTYFGNDAYKSFLETRKEEQIKKTSDETQRKMLDTMTFMSSEETKRTQILASAVKQNTQAAQIAAEAEVVQSELLKAASAGDSARLGGVMLTNDVTEALTQGHRRESKQVRLDGKYRIIKLDWSTPSLLKVKIQNIKTFEELSADVQDDTMDGKYKEAIKNAEWARKPLKLEINAKKIGDSDFREVVIVSVK